MPGSFVDTNILIYLAAADADRSDRVEALLASGVRVSVQVLNETANVLRRKASFSWDETRAFLSTIRSLVTVESLTVETHEEGLRIAERYRVSLYDGMIIAAALLAECEILWSEDMQDGLIVDTLQIRNPFRRPEAHSG